MIKIEPTTEGYMPDCELKNDMEVERLPSGKFEVNKTVTINYVRPITG